MARTTSGVRPNRTFATGGDPRKRHYENDAHEQARQRRYAEAEVRADGEHWNPNGRAKQSYEASERWFDAQCKSDPLGGFVAFLKIVWSSIWHMGMYSSDPEIARMAIVHTAGEQINVQRQLTAQQQQQAAALHARERAEDAAAADARMMAMARETAKETARALFDEADRRRAAGQV